MSARENFFNLDAMEQGINRELAEGMTTRVFPGDDAMISIVRIDANKSGKIHSHPGRRGSSGQRRRFLAHPGQCRARL